MCAESNTSTRIGPEQLAGVGRENIRVAAHFVNRPAAAAFADVFAERSLLARNVVVQIM